MTDEEAIKRLKNKLENDTEYANRCNPFSDLVHEVILDNKAVERVLNLIENQQREIKYWKDKYDKELTENIAYITKIVNQDNRIKELEKALEEKDSITDKTCEFLGDLQLSKDREGYEIMKKSDWKQYFEKRNRKC